MTTLKGKIKERIDRVWGVGKENKAYEIKEEGTGLSMVAEGWVLNK